MRTPGTSFMGCVTKANGLLHVHLLIVHYSCFLALLYILLRHDVRCHVFALCRFTLLFTSPNDSPIAKTKKRNDKRWICAWRNGFDTEGFISSSTLPSRFWFGLVWFVFMTYQLLKAIQCQISFCKYISDIWFLNTFFRKHLKTSQCYITYAMDFPFVSSDPVCFDKLSRCD